MNRIDNKESRDDRLHILIRWYFSRFGVMLDKGSMEELIIKSRDITSLIEYFLESGLVVSIGDIKDFLVEASRID